jgi:hypothetical protein
VAAARPTACAIAEGRKEAIEIACELYGIELTAAHRARIAALDAEGLADLLSQIRAGRRFP